MDGNFNENYKFQVSKLLSDLGSSADMFFPVDLVYSKIDVLNTNRYNNS